MKHRGPRLDVLAHLPALRRYARSLTRDADAAEDLLHDALLRAQERRNTFSSDRPLGPWLMKVLHNVFIDGARRRAAESRAVAAAGEAAPAWEEASQEHATRLAQVRAAFLQLPDDQRAALHLVSIDGLTYDEAAEVLGVPVGTVLSRVSRARAWLRAFEQDGRQQDGRSRPSLRIVGDDA